MRGRRYPAVVLGAVNAAGPPLRWDGATLSAQRQAELENEARLDSCPAPHEFRPLEPLAAPAAGPHRVRWRCVRCGCVVKGSFKRAYERGVADAERRVADAERRRDAR